MSGFYGRGCGLPEFVVSSQRFKLETESRAYDVATAFGARSLSDVALWAGERITSKLLSFLQRRTICYISE